MIARITPFSPIGEISAPPSKSVAHRLIILASLKKGRTRIANIGNSKDVLATLSCVKELGCRVQIEDDNAVIWGVQTAKSEGVFDCLESGSTLRFMIPVALSKGVNAKFIGSEKLLSRPNEKLFQVLEGKGVKIDGYNFKGKLRSGVYKIDSSVSSQYITGLLLALPNVDGTSEIILEGDVVSKDYINITLSCLDMAKIAYERTENGFKIFGNQEVKLPDEIAVEGDFSGAAFPLVLGGIGGDITVKSLNVSSRQGDRKIVQILQNFGAEVEINEGGVRVKKGARNPIEVDCQDIPDLAPIIAVLASCADGVSRLKNTERLKIKESDRIATTLDFLSRAGVKAEYADGTITVYGNGGKYRNAVYDGHNDHRVVMCEAVLSALAEGESEIKGAEAVNKSYVNFFDDLKKLGGNGNVQVDW